MNLNPLVAPICGLVGVMVGSILSLIGTLLSHYYLARRQQEQWILERNAEQEDWLREKLYEIYVNCLYFAGSAQTRERDQWYNLLLVNFPSSADYDEFYRKVKEDKLEANDIIELAAKDIRLKGNLGILKTKS